MRPPERGAWEIEQPPLLLSFVGLASLNALAVTAGYLSYLSAENVAAVWPAAGLLLVAYLRSPLERWPFLFAAGVLGEASAEIVLERYAPGSTLAFGINGQAEAMLGALLIRRWARGESGFDTPRGLVSILVAFAAAPVLAATYGSWIVTGLDPTLEPGTVWSVWWAGDFTGLVLVAPPLLAWTSGQSATFRELRPVPRWEFALYTLAVAFVCLVTLGPVRTPLRSILDHAYLAFPVLTLLAIRLGPRAACTAAFVIGGSAVAFARLGMGPFLGAANSPDELLGLQAFVAVVSLTAFSSSVLAMAHHRAVQQFELFFSQSMDACFFMKLDEPVRWDDRRGETTVVDDVVARQRITRVNEAMLKQYGATEAELIGKTPAEVLKGDPAHGKSMWFSFFDQGHVRFEMRTAKLDDSPFWVEGVYVCLYDDQGRIKGCFGIQRDITERKASETERESLIRKLEEKNAELERFAYTVSHDLKSPLVTIRGFLGHLRESAVSQDLVTLDEDIARISAATERMQGLLEELLELSRVGRVVRPSERVPLRDLVDQALRLVSGPIEARDAEVEIAPDLPVVVGDRGRIVQLLQNLIENAVKFMGEQPAPRIELASRLEDGEQVCYVRDNGIGIDRGYAEKVFGLFERLSSDTPGTGVGLALARRIVELHGGRLWVESEGQGKGSTFCFTLPCVDANGEQDASATEAKQQPG